SGCEQTLPGGPGSCGLIMVKRTKLTPVPVPAFGATGLRRWLSAAPKVPVAAATKLGPSVEVSTRKSLVAAVSSSPQVFPGSMANSEMFTACGSLTVTNFGTATPPASKSLVLPQPLPSDWSMAPVGPQPKAVKSGPLNAVTVPPPPSDAQSRRRLKFCVVVRAAMVMVTSAASKPGLEAETL